MSFTHALLGITLLVAAGAICFRVLAVDEDPFRSLSQSGFKAHLYAVILLGGLGLLLLFT